jgi:hypothetical protein
MIDFILFLLVLFIFLMGVQVGAWFGGIPQWIRWVADKVEGVLKDAKPK